MTGEVTPLIVTYNQATNIAGTLTRLDWALRIVVVDSFIAYETEVRSSGFSPRRSA